jgi:hypothetical protein
MLKSKCHIYIYIYIYIFTYDNLSSRSCKAVALLEVNNSKKDFGTNVVMLH